jgi:hypothetical protein
LSDQAFDSATFLAEADRTGAKLLVRGGTSSKLKGPRQVRVR